MAAPAVHLATRTSIYIGTAAGRGSGNFGLRSGALLAFRSSLACTVTGRAPPRRHAPGPLQSCLRRMDSAQRKQLKENGFLIVKDVLSPSTVARLNAIFVSAFGAPLSELSEPAPASSETLAPAGRTGNCGRRSLQVRCPGT